MSTLQLYPLLSCMYFILCGQKDDPYYQCVLMKSDLHPTIEHVMHVKDIDYV
jgi:hypothetical protein